MQIVRDTLWDAAKPLLMKFHLSESSKSLAVLEMQDRVCSIKLSASRYPLRNELQVKGFDKSYPVEIEL